MKECFNIYVVDETLIKAGSEFIWLWVAIYRTKKQGDSPTAYFHRKKHICSNRALSLSCLIKFMKSILLFQHIEIHDILHKLKILGVKAQYFHSPRMRKAW